HHAFSSGAGRTSDGNGSHASTLKSPSYTKSVSWQHYRYAAANNLSVIGVTKEDKQRISEILQETWESADDWFVSE
ncbi:DinI-like family protein, partial [Shigella flexneri]